MTKVRFEPNRALLEPDRKDNSDSKSKKKQKKLIIIYYLFKI